MFGSKRTCPFEYVEGGFGPGPSKVAKEDKASIYEATLEKLRLGARAAAASRVSAYPSPRSGSGREERQQLHGQCCHKYGNLAGGGVQQGENVNSAADDSDTPMHDSAPAAAGRVLTSLGQNDFPLPHISSSSSSSSGDRGGCPCYVCLSRAAWSTCSHCSRACCEVCCRRCEGCQELFCSVCSTTDYEERYERNFCFDCGAKASTQKRSFFRPYLSFHSDDSYLMECP